MMILYVVNSLLLTIFNCICRCCYVYDISFLNHYNCQKGNQVSFTVSIDTQLPVSRQQRKLICNYQCKVYTTHFVVNRGNLSSFPRHCHTVTAECVQNFRGMSAVFRTEVGGKMLVTFVTYRTCTVQEVKKLTFYGRTVFLSTVLKQTVLRTRFSIYYGISSKLRALKRLLPPLHSGPGTNVNAVFLQNALQLFSRCLLVSGHLFSFETELGLPSAPRLSLNGFYFFKAFPKLVSSGFC